MRGFVTRVLALAATAFLLTSAPSMVSASESEILKALGSGAIKENSSSIEYHQSARKVDFRTGVPEDGSEMALQLGFCVLGKPHTCRL
jgi:hypothetical protein